ncbi:unnamed protein product [Callosobruchus maculatus]|uniref:Integrase catalytic domain-containing protein n=1 Tax=Callosobruchus maculatus TaxID=64391 RepID=A0A653CVD3_CALMS|nr:unnamed protein product [Callosobruchus maculatus]
MATVAERKLKLLNSKKESIYTTLQTLLDLSKNLTDVTNRTKFLALYHRMESSRQELLTVIDQIQEVSFEIDENHVPSYGSIHTINEICGHIMAAAENIKNPVSSGASTSNSGNNDQNIARGRPSLPNVELPVFSGDVRQWPTFYEIFRSLIHENPSLSSSDKIYYLIGKLRGEALSICSGISATGDNYDIIWKTLLETYQDKRFLANSYLSQIFGFKTLRNEGSLNLFLEKFDSAVSALKKLELPDLSDYILFYLASSKLDNGTLREFNAFKRGTEIPTYSDLKTFVSAQVKNLKVYNLDIGSNGKSSRSSHVLMTTTDSRQSSSWPENCLYCRKAGHLVVRCEKFKALSPGKRYETVKRSNWCFNCLSDKHGVKNCTSKKKCSECSRNHHFLLHLGRADFEKNKSTAAAGLQAAAEIQSAAAPATGLQSAAGVQSAAGTSSEVQGDSFCSVGLRVQKEHTVLLSTVVVDVGNSVVANGKARFILDSGSQINLVTLDCCKKLGLKINKSYCSVRGLGQSIHSVKGTTELVLSSRHDSETVFTVRAFVINEITDQLPQVAVDDKHFRDFVGLKLADEGFYIPGKIDGIIGAEIYSEIMGVNKVIGPGGSPVAVQTAFGYVVMGRVPVDTWNSVNTFFTLQADLPVEELVAKFWEVENVPTKPVLSEDDKKCETIFAESVQRSISGRFTVALPFKFNPSNLGVSKFTAQKRFCSLEKRLECNKDFRFQYNEAMKDFMQQGHLVLSDKTSEVRDAYYIAHHPVIKAGSSSTPVRVVLDASAPTDNGVSLNDLLYRGPKLQTDICTLLLNFRLFEIALTGDIRQMYRQINVVRDHWRYQRLLWRFNPDEDIQEYELTVVAFGMKSSPFLALRTVKELTKLDGKTYPLAAEYVDRDLYMDDLVSSISSEELACKLFQEAIGLFASGGFELTKFSTNSVKLTEIIPVAKKRLNDVLFKTDTRILGMQWNPQSDRFSFQFSFPEKQCTKRNVLSSVARCYDPLGLIAPIVLNLKLIVKDLWRLKLDWDSEAPASIGKIWVKILSEWDIIKNLNFPRHLGVKMGLPVVLLGFSDASQSGYGGVIYSLCQTAEGTNLVSLVCAKSKVSPIKIMSIPRLELCAALLLSKLLKHVIETYEKRVAIAQVYAFSDSSTVLHWLASIELKDIFVANRVCQIKENLPSVQWYYVEGNDNPADCLSRGLTPGQMTNHPLWFSGPSWLKLSKEEWPLKSISGTDDNSVEKIGVIFTATETENHPLIEMVDRCSNFSKILRVTVWVLRFLKILPFGKYISVKDLHYAEHYIIRLVQLKHFGAEMQRLESGKHCSAKLAKLQSFIGEGLLRVGGRLANSDLSYSQKHPVILPAKSCFTDKLVDHYHRINLHTGAYLLECLLRQKYWIMGGRNLIRQRVYKCNKCFRLKPKNVPPLMANLPAQRVQATKAFLHTGVDYFGPLRITLGRKRGAQVYKAYVCLFVCMSVKAIHLELVSSLSTQHFVQAFKRFISRRGPCKVLYSDRGTNFVGAKTVLRELNQFLSSATFQNSMITELSDSNIEWKFNTPAAPHMGGLWESNVKSVKIHLYRVVGDQLLTFEEMSTVLTQIESLLNSRPLCVLSRDSETPEALTPSHFLCQMPLNSLPAETVEGLPLNRLDRFQLIDRMIQDFWKRWRLEYLTSLQSRVKWYKPGPKIQPGTVVVLREDNSPPLHWPLGIIKEVFPGKDGHIRNVTVKTSKGIFSRPVIKVFPLPTQ